MSADKREHCDGLHALGACKNAAKYRLYAGVRVQFSCGVHLAQLVKAMLRPDRPVQVEVWA